MFSALMNAQNKSGGATIPITGAVFQYSNNGTTWTNMPSPVGITYDSLTYQLRVLSTTPAGATYTITSNPTATNQGQTAQMVITGSGSYTGTIVSPQLVILQRTITATGTTYGEGAFQPDSCLVGGAVSGFNITLGNLINGATGVTLTVLYGADSFVPNNILCPVSGNINLEGAVSSQVGTNPYQNVIYTTNGVKTFYTNYNTPPSYFWCVINANEWESGGQTIGNPAYNSNYTSPTLSFAGSPAPFYNSCQT